MQRREMIRSCGCGRARSPRYPPLPPPLPPPSFSPRFSPQRYVSRVTSRREMFSINPVLRMTVVPYTSGVADSPVPSASDRAIGGNPPTPPPLHPPLSHQPLLPPVLLFFSTYQNSVRRRHGELEFLNGHGLLYHPRPLPTLLILPRNSKVRETPDGWGTRDGSPAALSASAAGIIARF